MSMRSLLFLTMCCLMFSRYVAEVCHVCHNGGGCHLSSSGEPVCLCKPGTSGSVCETYNRDAISASPNNIALGKSVIHCKSGDKGIDLANPKIRSNDVCYSILTDNVMIVDLGGIYTVGNVTIDALDQPPWVVTVSVGWHLGEGCSVTDETSCAPYISVWNNSLQDIHCNPNTTGRYIRIQYNTIGTDVFCVHQASGVPVSQRLQQAWFSNSLYVMSTVSPYKDFLDVSKLSCARWCLQDPICLNFRWHGRTCSLYGGSPGGLFAVTAYRYQGIV